MVHKTTRAIHALLIGLALAGCGAQAAPTSPPPRPTSPPAAQSSPLPTAPVAEAPTTAAPTPAPTEAGSADAAWPEPTATPPFPEQQITAANVAQVELLRTVGFGQAQDAAFSPDQRLLAVATTGGIVWYAMPGLVHRRFDPIAGGVNYIRFIDGQTVETITDLLVDADRLELRRVADGSVIESRSDPRPEPRRGHIIDSPAGDLQARFALPNASPEPGVTIVRQADNATLYEDEDSLSIAFAAERATVALVTYQGVVRVVDLLSGRTSEVYLPGYDAATFSPDGQQLVTAGRQLSLWDVVSGRLMQNDDLNMADEPQLLGRRQRLRYSADGSELTVDGAYLVFEATVRIGDIWTVADGRVSANGGSSIGSTGYNNHQTYAGAISPANHDGAVTEDGFTLQLQRGQETRLVLDRQSQVKALEFSPDGGRLAIADVQGAVDIVNIEDGSLVQSFSGDPSLSALTFSEDGALLAGTSDGGALQVWETASGRTAAILPAAGALARPVFTSDDALLLVPSREGVSFYRLNDGALLRTIPASYALPAEGQSSVALAIGPNRRLLLVLRDGYVELWGIR